MTRLRTVELYQDEQRKIIAIEAVELNQTKFNSTGQVNASITPLVLVVCSSDGNEVVAVDTDKTNMATLKELYAELDELIADIC